MIEFQCDNCGWRFSVHASDAGKKGKCPRCGRATVIPGLEDSSSEANSGFSGIDSSLFDIPKKKAEESIAQEQMSAESFEGLEEPEKGVSVNESEPEEVAIHKLPWFIDIFLYPFNSAGIIHLVGLWLLIFLLCPLVMAVVGLGTEYAPIVYFLPVAYVLYYFTECTRDSTSGHFRAPDFWMHPTDSDRWDCVSQMFVVVGSIAVCFWPVAVYYIATERNDLIYWLLLACGGFFFPMVLLAAVLFDSFNAFNPLLIVTSILSTFIPYCGLVIILFVGSYICLRINSRFYSFHPMPIVPFFLRAIQLYMVFIAAGLLGRFYRHWRDRLNWEV